jgi:hypothetical protein
MVYADSPSNWAVQIIVAWILFIALWLLLALRTYFLIHSRNLLRKALAIDYSLGFTDIEQTSFNSAKSLLRRMREITGRSLWYSERYGLFSTA